MEPRRLLLVACVIVLCVCAPVAGRLRSRRRAAAAAYPTIPYLPDPFAFQNGTRITSLDQWPALAAEQRELLQRLELGTKPPVPEVRASFDGTKTLTVHVEYQGETISFNCSITYPTNGTGPFPAVIGIGGVSLGAALLSQLGVATISFPNDKIAQQTDASSRGKGLFYDLYGADADAGAMMAWAWGVDCLVTALEQTAAVTRIDTKHLATNGCSRNGKGAMIVAVFVERIVLGIPQESGSGGADTWRVSDWMEAQGIKTQTLSEIVQEDVWFASQFADFAGATTTLPFDHHTLASLMGPSRAILFVENTGIDWLGGYSGWVMANAAQQVFSAFGVPDSIGFTGVSHQDHCAFQTAQAAPVTAFVQKFLLGQEDVDTAVMTTESNATIDASWVPWTAPVQAPQKKTKKASAPAAAPCFAAAVDEGSDGAQLKFSVRSETQTVQAVRVLAGAGVRRSVSLHPVLGGQPADARGVAPVFAVARHVRAPFTLEVLMTDGASCRAHVPELHRGRAFECA